MSTEKKFKHENKQAACTKRPWEFLLPKDQRIEILFKVKQECLQLYEHDFEECSKRMVCFGKKCLGRPLEWLSPTALPYLKQFAKIVGIKENEDYTIETDCTSCPMFKNCTYSCAQVTDFMRRDSVPEPQLSYKENIDNLTQQPERVIILDTLVAKGRKVPWDALPTKRRQTVEKYLYEQKDFLSIAKDLGYTDQKNAQYAFWAALTTLSEYATMRKFIDEKGPELTSEINEILKSLYIDNMSITDLAEKKNVSKQTIQQRVSRVIKKYNVNWHKFVKKQGNKIVYSTVEVIR